jgi:hypothetical protein
MSLLQSSVAQIQKYAAILDIVPDESPLIQCLLAFIDTGEEEDMAFGHGRHISQSADSGGNVATSQKDRAPEDIIQAPIEDLRVSSNLVPKTLPKRMWQGATRFIQRARQP